MFSFFLENNLATQKQSSVTVKVDFRKQWLFGYLS